MAHDQKITRKLLENTNTTNEMSAATVTESSSTSIQQTIEQLVDETIHEVINRYKTPVLESTVNTSNIGTVNLKNIANNTDYMLNNVIDYSIINGKSKQDYVIGGNMTMMDLEEKSYSAVGDTHILEAEPYSFIVLMDGHGVGRYVNEFHKQPWKEIIVHRSPEQISTYLKNNVRHNNSFNCGSTLSIVKMFNNRIECMWTGDSEIVIYKDKQVVFRSLSHNCDNLVEHERLTGHKNTQGVLSGNFLMTRCIKSSKPHVLTPTSITMKDSSCYNHTNGFVSPLTRSFGHINKIECDFDTHTIPIAKDDHTYKVVIASDGLWDMISDTVEDTNMLITENAYRLAREGHRRWKQEWDYTWRGKYIKNRFPDNQTDDVSVGIMVFNRAS
jgi:serine/threonine protein phosphatase PrpC